MVGGRHPFGRAIVVIAPDVFGAIVAGGAGATLLLAWIAQKASLWDRPNARSSHRHATSRAGGFAVAGGAWVGLALAVAVGLWTTHSGVYILLMGCAAAALGLGLWDDARGLPPFAKLMGQTAIAAAFVLMGPRYVAVPIPWTESWPLGGGSELWTILWIVGFMNVFNFMDGLNGMAAGAALVGGLVLTVAGIQIADGPTTAIGAAILSVSIGFLPSNLRGRLFLGDGGSHLLGFLLAAAAPIAATATGGASALGLIPIALTPFLVDVAATLVRRALRGAPLGVAHREHLYQRLQQSGWTHGQVSAVYAVVCACCGVGALAALRHPPVEGGLTAAVLATTAGGGAVLDAIVSRSAKP